MSKMINCQQCLDFIADYLAGEVSQEATEQFEEHLNACPPCRDYIESYKRTIEMERDCMKVDDCECRAMPESLVKAICEARKAGEQGA